MRRIVVVGTVGSGKSTLAQTIAKRLSIPHAEMDAFMFGPNWKQRSQTEFQDSLIAFSAQERWVIDGSYGYEPLAREVLWPQADTIIWLDYPAPVVFWRVFIRAVWRSVTGAELWNGNRDRLRSYFLSRQSLFLMAYRTHWVARVGYPQMFVDYPDLKILRLRFPGEAEELLREIRPPKSTVAA